MQDMKMQVPDESELQEATPEEEAQLEEAELLSLEMIHGEQGEQISNIVMQAQDPLQGIGEAAATVVVGVDQRLGGLFPAVAYEILDGAAEELAGLAAEAGIIPPELDDQQSEMVAQVAGQTLDHLMQSVHGEQQAQMEPQQPQMPQQGGLMQMGG